MHFAIGVILVGIVGLFGGCWLAAHDVVCDPCRKMDEDEGALQGSLTSTPEIHQMYNDNYRSSNLRDDYDYNRKLSDQ